MAGFIRYIHTIRLQKSGRGTFALARPHLRLYAHLLVFISCYVVIAVCTVVADFCNFCNFCNLLFKDFCNLIV